MSVISSKTGNKLITLAVLILAGGLVNTVNAEDITIVKDHKAQCRLVVPKSKDQWLKLATDDLKDYIFKSTGAKLKVVYDKSPDNKLVNIHIGPTDYVKKLNLDLPSPQGFVIQFPDQKNIVIVGRPIDGIELNTMYGAHCFLEKYVGVKWLFPLELGEYVPKHDSISVPMKNILEKPSFLRRSNSGLGKAYKSKKDRLAGLVWGMRQGYLSGSGLQYNHNIGNILPPDKYTKTHPEFFPEINGKRFLPKPNPKNRKWRLNYWDGCYTAPGIVDEAAKNIIAYFDANPGKNSYSLSINDNVNICQCSKCRAKNKDFPEGMSSQSYYEWVNAVVKKVRKKYPDKYFGLLSYQKVVLPPKNIKLDDHIVPVLCRDLVYWADPETRKNVDEKRIDAWSAIAPTFGLWDYLNSGAYIVPRTTSHHTADTLKYLYKRGMRFYSGELHPAPEWKNAPQAYLRFKLLWNINLDPDKVLKGWYEACVGKKAAPYLEQYYNLWEDFWTKRVIKTEWFKNGAATRPYLERKTLGYLVALKQDDLDKCEKLLQKTCELAGTPKQKKRAKFILDYFLFAKKKYLEPYIEYVKMSQANMKITRKALVVKFNCDKNVKDWKPWKKSHSTGKFFCDKREGCSKKGSLSVDTRNSLPSTYVFRNNVDIDSGKIYRVSAMVKTKNVSPRCNITLRLRFISDKGGFMGADVNHKRIYQYAETIHGGTKDKWRKLQICFKVPDKAWNDVKAMAVWFTFGTGEPNARFWLDDVTVEEVAAKKI